MLKLIYNLILMENIKLYSDFYYYNENIKNTYLIIGDYKKNISQTYELTFHYSLIDMKA